MDFNKLANKIHKANVAKGFWDKKRNEGEVLMLTISELSEALEGDRKDRYSNQTEFTYLDGLGKAISKASGGEKRRMEHSRMNYFTSHIKDSVGDELADAMIRMLDYQIGFKLKISPARINSYNEYSSRDKMKNFGEELLKLSCMICRMYAGEVRGSSKKEDKEMLGDYVISRLMWIADQKKINLEKHIEYKMMYNATRPKMHNKKY